VAELADLMEALAARDGKAARLAGSRHVRNAAAVAIDILRKSQQAEREAAAQ